MFADLTLLPAPLLARPKMQLATHRAARFVAVGMLLLCVAPAPAQGLHTIDNPGGGQLVYGPMDDQTTPQAAMVSVLRLTHTHFGGRPQVSTIFQSTDKQTYGAYFTLTASTQGNRPMAGLVLINMSQGATPAAAVMYDDAARFAKTEPAMVHTLTTAWNAASPSAGAASPGQAAVVRSAGPPVLHMQSGGDGSAHIGLPADWHITAVAGGQLTAEGPDGEQIGLGILFGGIHDPNIRSSLSRFDNPNAPGQLRYPMGGDIFAAYASIVNQNRQFHHLPPASFHLTKSAPTTPFTQGEHAITAEFDLDLNDGKGPRTASARIGEIYMQNSPTYSMNVQTSNIPKPFVAAESATVKAILSTFNQDSAVLNAEVQTSLANTRAIGERSRQQAADADARRVASSAAFNQHMTDLDIASKRQQNYTMDRSELQDNTLNARGAIDNNVAAALIRANPDRYQEVPSTSFLKGVDY